MKKLNKMNFNPVNAATIKTILNDDELIADSQFKIIFTEPKVSINLLQTLIPYLNTDDNKSVDTILKECVSTYQFDNKELLGVPLEERAKIILEKPSELTTGGGKTFRYDVLFDYKIGSMEKDLYTINFEMQKKDKEYDMLERALCYAMTLSSSILKKGDNYNKLHKVFSIWFLNFNYFDDDIAVHSIAPRIYYNKSEDILTKDMSKQTTPVYHPNADLVEVVFIELTKRKKVRNSEKLKNILEAMCANEDKFKTIKLLFDLTDEEVEAMLLQKDFVDEVREEGRAEGREEERKNIVRLMLSNGMTEDQISKILSISINEIKTILEK